jgi:TetR/AcrR family transcriptional regulator
LSGSKNVGGAIRRRNKAKIFSAAKQEFVKYGFKGASIKRIAEIANIPRANIHYYFKNKEDLYRQLLNEILDMWNSRYDSLNSDLTAKQSLTAYIRAKVMYSKTDPEASRIFASEIIHGAPHLKDYLAEEFTAWVQSKVAVIQHWIDDGQINPINPYHLLFLIWSASQHYADFNVQVTSAMGKNTLDEQDFEDIAASLTTIILTGCGIKDTHD